MKFGWLPLETGLADIAFVSLMVNWTRRRKRAQLLNILDTTTATPLVDDILERLSGAETAGPAVLKRARMAANAARRVVNSHAFDYLTIAAFNKNSFLHREARSFFAMLGSQQGPRASSGGSFNTKI